jgi:hypothetical protein
MAMIDPERERLRLTAFYATEMDGRLEKIAAQAYELSDIARETLRAELAKRGLATQLAEKAPETPAAPPAIGDPPLPPPEEPDDGEFEFRRRFTVRSFRDLPEALLAKGKLDSSGIDCALVDENVIRMDWFWSNLMGGIKLIVDADDAATAEEVLAQPIPEHLDVSGVGDFEQPLCPKCGSLDISFRETAPVAYVSTMLLNFPIPLHRRAWRCRSCFVEWQDDGLPDPSQSPS